MSKEIKIYFLMLLIGISTLSTEKACAMDQDVEHEINKLPQAQPTSQAMTLEQFDTSLTNNNFLKKLGKNYPAIADERYAITFIPEYINSVGGGIVNRPLQFFKGDTMLVGGGKKVGNGVSDLQGIETNIQCLENRTYAFNPTTGELLDEATRQTLIESYKMQVKKVQDKYYTVNMYKPSEPDLVASITNIKDLSTISDKHFQTVIFEYVNPQVWFCQTIFENLERIVKPKGEIVIEGITHSRLLVVAFASTKWANGINQQLENNIINGITTPSTITLIN